MAKMPDNKRRRSKAIMLGVGMDSDGHKRITTGPNFLLAGGTQETHEVMTEKVIKINEKITARGKTLDTVSRPEFEDIAHSLGLHQHDPEKPNDPPKPNANEDSLE
jgi:hypothetical protein